MSQEMEGYLSLSLKKLDRIIEEVVKTQGYSQETEELRMLKELIKEQMPHEDTRHSTCTTR